LEWSGNRGVVFLKKAPDKFFSNRQHPPQMPKHKTAPENWQDLNCSFKKRSIVNTGGLKSSYYRMYLWWDWFQIFETIGCVIVVHLNRSSSAMMLPIYYSAF